MAYWPSFATAARPRMGCGGEPDLPPRFARPAPAQTLPAALARRRFGVRLGRCAADVAATRAGKLDHGSVGAHVERWILDDQPEPSSLERLQRLSQVLPGQGAAIDDGPVRAALRVPLQPA